MVKVTIPLGMVLEGKIMGILVKVFLAIIIENKVDYLVVVNNLLPLEWVLDI